MSIKTGYTLTDKALVAEVLKGNANAFSIIIKNTEGLVAQIVFKMINNAEDRKDMVQDIYFKVYKNLAGFKFGSKLSTWVAQVSYNTCLDYLRKKKLVLVDSFNEENDDEENSGEKDRLFGNTNNTANSLFSQKELSRILQQEIEKLSPVYKTLIMLYHNEEMSYAEIAQITLLPEGTLKNYLFRARKTLKNGLLKKYKKEEL